LRSGQPQSLDWSCECPPLVHTVARLSFVNTFVPWFALQPNVGSYSATLTRILSGEFWSTNNLIDNEILYRYWSGKAKLRLQTCNYRFLCTCFDNSWDTLSFKRALPEVYFKFNLTISVTGHKSA
jgi:hypothetical protein